MDIRVRFTPYKQEHHGPRQFYFWRWGFDLRVGSYGIEAMLLATHSYESAAIDEGRLDYAVRPYIGRQSR